MYLVHLATGEPTETKRPLMSDHQQHKRNWYVVPPDLAKDPHTPPCSSADCAHVHPAIYICLKCRRYLCEECWANHHFEL